MSEKYKGMALGMFELDNLVACFVALDAAAKTANIRIQGVERMSALPWKRLWQLRSPWRR